MMSDSRSREILDQWREVAHAAALPADAPRPSHQIARYGLAGAPAIVIVVIATYLALGGGRPDGPTSGALGSAVAVASEATIPPTTPAATRSVAPTTSPSSVPLPSVGGTCWASQFALGKVTYSYAYGTLASSVVWVYQPLRNVGGGCVLDLPTTIGVAPAAGPFQPVPALNDDTSSSWTIKTDESLTIVLRASWANPGFYEGGGFTPPPCSRPIGDVTRAEFPFAHGNLEIDLGTVWSQVCSSPVSVSLTVQQDAP